MFAHRSVNRLRAIVVSLSLLMLSSFVFAQGSATPIQIGQNAIGSLTASASTAQYTLTASAGETAQVLLLSASPGFAVSVTVTNSAGIDVLSLPNTTAQPTLSGSLSFDDAGVYTIQVGSANGTFGQFALSLQAGTPLPQPVDLTVNQPITDTVGSAAPVRVYRFSTTSAAPSLLTILSASPTDGALISLYDEDTSKTIATNDAGISGIAYRLSPQDGRYHVEVRANGASGDVSFTICLGDCGAGLLTGQATAEAQATLAPTVGVAPTACTVASRANGSVNIRSGPGAIYAIISILPAGQSAPVLGQFTGGGWYEISFNGGTGWVSGSVTQLTGDCTALTTVAAPANAPLAPTLLPPTAPPAALPTSASSGGGGGAPHTTATTAPTEVPTTGSSTSDLPDLVVHIDSATYEQYAGKNIVDIQVTVSDLNAPDLLTSDDNYKTVVCVASGCAAYDDSMGKIVPYSLDTKIVYTAPADSISIPVTATVNVDNEIRESNVDNNTATYSISLHSVSISPHR